jgi:uncharacterized damage-inducible protein DinB
MVSQHAEWLLHELNSEYAATRKCLERFPHDKFSYKPHPKSMEMGYLAVLVAAMPLWLKYIGEDGEIDLTKFARPDIKSTQDLVDYFEQNMGEARRVLAALSDEDLEKEFTLKRDGQELYKVKRRIDLPVTLNHWVHHRGQLTVYMRLNDIDVPSVYGPSADDRSFSAPK